VFLGLLDVGKSVIGKKFRSFRKLRSFGFQVFFVFSDCIFVKTLKVLRKNKNFKEVLAIS
jgi:hypothetical protein